MSPSSDVRLIDRGAGASCRAFADDNELIDHRFDVVDVAHQPLQRLGLLPALRASLEPDPTPLALGPDAGAGRVRLGSHLRPGDHRLLGHRAVRDAAGDLHKRIVEVVPALVRRRAATTDSHRDCPQSQHHPLCDQSSAAHHACLVTRRAWSMIARRALPLGS